MNSIRASNRLDPDQARHFVGPDLGPICLQRLSADDTSRQRVKGINVHIQSLTANFVVEFIRIHLGLMHTFKKSHVHTETYQTCTTKYILQYTHSHVLTHRIKVILIHSCVIIYI